MSSNEATILKPVPQHMRKQMKICDGPKDLTFIERTTLFVMTMHRESALRLLDGFGPDQRKKARAFARNVADWTSSVRQARLTSEFGTRPDALRRLQYLIVESPPLFRRAIALAIPPQWHEHFPHLISTETEQLPPAMRMLAARLVREALR